jgi:hypothetical protein
MNVPHSIKVLAPPPSPPPCPASVVTRDDCVAYCKEQPGAKRHGMQVKPPAGGVGNISECYCTVKTTPPTDYSCSRTPTPLPPIPANRGPCKTEGVTGMRSCKKHCNSYRRAGAKTAYDDKGLLTCWCQEKVGGSNELYCKNLRPAAVDAVLPDFVSTESEVSSFVRGPLELTYAV